VGNEYSSEESDSDFDEEESNSDDGENGYSNGSSNGEEYDRHNYHNLTKPPSLALMEKEPQLEELADLVGLHAASLYMEPFHTGRSDLSLLVYFSGILGFSSDGLTFQRPSTFIPKLSSLVYSIRLVLLKKTLLRHAHPYIG
jgi:hypothetical protein